jgi:hypothetical protein
MIKFNITSDKIYLISTDEKKIDVLVNNSLNTGKMLLPVSWTEAVW